MMVAFGKTQPHTCNKKKTYYDKLTNIQTTTEKTKEQQRHLQNTPNLHNTANSVVFEELITKTAELRYTDN